MAHDVFVSYAPADKPAADAAVAILEQDGLRCWISPRDVLPGHSYAEDIVEAIHQARLVVLLLSAHANHSETVNRELERAVSAGLPILPIRLEEVTPSGQLTYYLSDAHWLDAITPPLEQHLHDLADTIRFLLSQEKRPLPAPPAAPATGEDRAKTAVVLPPPVAGTGASEAGERTTGSPRWRRPALIASAVAGVILAAVLIFIIALTVFGGDGDDAATDDDSRSDTGVQTYVELLPVGDCYDPRSAGTVEVVDCEEDHRGEVTGRVEHPADAGDPFPGDDELAAWTDEACLEEAEAYVQPPFEVSELIAFGVYPNAELWEQGDRLVVCVVESTLTGTPLVGSVSAGS